MMDNADLIKRFLDMANCADACYAKGLEYVINEKDETGKEKPKKIADNDESDGSTLGYESLINKKWISTYARAIEARFNEEKVIGEDCRVSEFSAIPACSPKTLGNDITNIPKDTPHDQISQRTKDFVSRFELLEHKPDDKESGFSATLFKDTGMIEGKKVKDKEQYIFAIKGSNELINDGFDADVSIFLSKLPRDQYLDLLDFYGQCVKEHPEIKDGLTL